MKKEVIDILELNRLRRQLIFQSYMWDHRLIYAASLDSQDPPNSEETSSEPIQKPLGDTEKNVDLNIQVEMENSSRSESIVTDSKPAQILDHTTVNNLIDVVPQIMDLFVNSDHGHQTPVSLSPETKASDESDPLVLGVTVRRALSDGQAPICLSDTLDAAWTGEMTPGVGIPKNYSFSELVKADAPSTVASEKSDMEDHKEDISSSKVSQLPSAKGSDVVDDTVSWLGMSFVSFYRSLNKNILGTAQKLDTWSQHDPVYISAYRYPNFRGGPQFLLPVGVNDTVIPVYDDEPTSIISYALVSPDYFAQLSDEPDSITSTQSLDAGSFQSFHSLDELVLESYKSLGSGDESMLSSFRSSLPLDPVSYTKALHARVSFMADGSLGKVKYTVTCYFAKRFEALRRICCPSEVDFIRSLSRCKKWGAQGGKSNVFFAKSLDDRFIIKQVTKTELESFIKFAPGYFKYLSESICSGSPTCLAKILGIYQVYL